MSDQKDDFTQKLIDALIIWLIWNIFYGITMWVARQFVPEDEDGEQNGFLVGLVWCIEVLIIGIFIYAVMSPPYHESQKYTPAQWRAYIDRKCVQHVGFLDNRVNLQVEPPTIQEGLVKQGNLKYSCMPVDGGDMPLEYKEFERAGGKTEQLKFPEELGVDTQMYVYADNFLSTDPKRFNTPRMYYKDHSKHFNTYSESNN